MKKRINLILAAMAAIAVAIPATASASTGLTNSKGVPLPLGTSFKGSNTNTWTISGLGVGRLTCNNSTLLGQVTKNTTEGVEAKEAGASVNQSCFQNGSTPITIDNLVLGSLISAPNEPGRGRFDLSYVMHVGGLNCKFVLKNDVFNYQSSKSSIYIVNQPQTVSPAACGAGGMLSVSYELKTQASPPESILIK